MAESVDALVSNTSGAIRAGSTPALGTMRRARLFVFKHLALLLLEIIPILFPINLNTKDIILTGCRAFIQKQKY